MINNSNKLSNMDKLDKINAYLEIRGVEPLNKNHYHLIDAIYDIYINNHVIETDNDMLLNIIGDYYHYDRIYDDMIKYYTLAIERGNSDAMCSMGRYYGEYHIQCDIGMMMKYYMMAIDKDNSEAMYKLGRYYHLNHDNDKAIKYYTMAIERQYKCHGWYWNVLR